MSICREHELSDLYMYISSEGIECDKCSIKNSRTLRNQVFQTATAAYRHLILHIMRGDKVPGYAMLTLLDMGAVHRPMEIRHGIPVDDDC